MKENKMKENGSMTTHSKVIALKMKSENVEFDTFYKESFELFKQFTNEFVAWGNDEIYQYGSSKRKKDDQKISLIPVIEDIYKSVEKKATAEGISKTDFRAVLKYLYHQIINVGNSGRSYGTSLFGGCEVKEKLSKQDISNIVECVKELELCKSKQEESDAYDKILLKEKITHIVKSGETAGDITKKYNQATTGRKTSSKGFFDKSTKTEVKYKDIKDDTLLQDGSTIFIKSSVDLFVKKVCNTLREINFFDRLPFKNNHSNNYGLLFSMLSQIESWKTISETTKKSHEEHGEKIASMVKKLDLTQTELMKDFAAFCIENNITKKFDHKFKRHMEDCVIPSFKNGKIPDKLFYFNIILAKKTDEQIDYSLSSEFYTKLFSMPNLWQEEEAFIVKNINLIEEITIFNKRRNYACCPLIKEKEYDRFQIQLNETNFLKFQFDPKNVVNIDENTTEATVGFDEKLKLVVCADKKYAFSIFTQCKYHGNKHKPNTYFNNLKIIKVIESKSNSVKSMKYTFEFTKRNELKRAEIKQPSIVYKNNNYYIRINMNVILDADQTSYKIINNNQTASLPSYFQSSLPFENNRGKIHDKGIVHWEKIKNRKIIAMGVDLGVRRPFSYAIGNFTLNKDILDKNDVNIVASGFNLCSDSDVYFQVFNQIKTLAKFIGKLKSHNKGLKVDFEKDKKYIFDLVNDAKAYFKDMSAKRINDTKDNISNTVTNKERIYGSFVSESAESAIQCAIDRSEKESGLTLKKDISWLVNVLSKYLERKFKEVKNNRKYTNVNKCDNCFNWLRVIENIKRLKRSISYLGEDLQKNPELKIELKNLNEYGNNVKSDFLKQIASNIIKVAIEHKCDIVFIEKLGKADSRSRKLNEMFSFWSPKAIKKAIENAASWHGIPVVEVDPSCTSKVHYETNLFGHRIGNDLYYVEDQCLKKVDADINAAKQILVRGATRHGNISSINIKYLQAKIAELNSEANSEEDKEEIKQGGKRIQGFLWKKYGNITNITNQLTAAHKERESKFDYIYLHNDKWIAYEDRNEIKKDIEKRLE